MISEKIDLKETVSQFEEDYFVVSHPLSEKGSRFRRGFHPVVVGDSARKMIFHVIREVAEKQNFSLNLNGHGSNGINRSLPTPAPDDAAAK